MRRQEVSQWVCRVLIWLPREGKEKLVISKLSLRMPWQEKKEIASGRQSALKKYIYIKKEEERKKLPSFQERHLVLLLLAGCLHAPESGKILDAFLKDFPKWYFFISQSYLLNLNGNDKKMPPFLIHSSLMAQGSRIVRQFDSCVYQA